jgi:hypothetical protein
LNVTAVRVYSRRQLSAQRIETMYVGSKVLFFTPHDGPVMVTNLEAPIGADQKKHIYCSFAAADDVFVRLGWRNIRVAKGRSLHLSSRQTLLSRMRSKLLRHDPVGRYRWHIAAIAEHNWTGPAPI